MTGWNAETIDPQRAWYVPLSPQAVEALEGAVADGRRGGASITALAPDDGLRRACAAEVATAAEALENGRGFVILEGLPIDRLGRDGSTAAYWLLGRLLGEPMAQNVQGTLLYDVRDAGGDLTQGARFSVTSYESSFHTDNSFGEAILDYVGLLCLQTAKSGGSSQVVDGRAVYDVLCRERAHVLKTLMQPFHVERRGGARPGEAPTILFPVIARHGDELLFRYLRYWIEAGHSRVGQPLTPAQREALDQLDEVLARPSLRAEFHLRPGDAYFINNRWVLHNRTAFEDFPEPERKRHLVRLWLVSLGEGPQRKRDSAKDRQED